MLEDVAEDDDVEAVVAERLGQVHGLQVADDEALEVGRASSAASASNSTPETVQPRSARARAR